MMTLLASIDLGTETDDILIQMANLQTPKEIEGLVPMMALFASTDCSAVGD